MCSMDCIHLQVKECASVIRSIVHIFWKKDNIMLSDAKKIRIYKYWIKSNKYTMGWNLWLGKRNEQNQNCPNYQLLCLCASKKVNFEIILHALFKLALSFGSIHFFLPSNGFQPIVIGRSIDTRICNMLSLIEHHHRRLDVL